jgi:hypothetical protein
MTSAIAVAPGRAAPANVVANNRGAITGLRTRHPGLGGDGVGIWLHAAVGLHALAGPAAAASFSARYRLLRPAGRRPPTPPRWWLSAWAWWRWRRTAATGSDCQAEGEH